MPNPRESRERTVSRALKLCRRDVILGAVSLLTACGCASGTNGDSINRSGYKALDILPLSGDNTINLAGVNNGGVVAGTSSYVAVVNPSKSGASSRGLGQLGRPFIWSGGRITSLPTLPGAETNSLAIAINDSGVVLGVSGTKPVLWELVGSSMSIREIPGLADNDYFNLVDLNNSGVILGSNFLWKNGVKTSLPFAGGIYISRGFNEQGSVVGFQDIGVHGVGFLPFVLKSDSVVSLPIFTGSELLTKGGGANDINNKDLIVGHSFHQTSDANLDDRAVIWQNGQMIDLSPLIAQIQTSGVMVESSFAVSVNNQGDVVGNFLYNGGYYDSFLYSNGKMSSLQMPPTQQLTYNVIDINDNGIIISQNGRVLIPNVLQ